MTNVSTVEMARAAPSPGKTESSQTPKGDEDFKKCLEACCQEDNKKKVDEAPVNETVKEAAEIAKEAAEAVKAAVEAAALLLAVAPVQAEPVQVELPAAEIEAAPVAAVPAQPVELPTRAEGEAKVEAAPVQTDAPAPVKAEAKVEVAPFAENLKAAETAKAVETQAVVAPRVEAETAPATPTQVEAAPVQQVAVNGKPVVKAAPAAPVETVETVETTTPAAITTENISGKVAVDLTSVPEAARPAELMHHVSKEVALMATTGRSNIHIQIQPENMGKIDVQLISNSDGMQVVMTTDSAATGKILESNLNQLQKSLSDAGLQISGLSVNSQGLQGQFSNSFKEQAAASSRFYPKQTAVAALPVEAIAGRYINQLSGLDFRV